jgi:hypothetical protein
VNVQLYLLNEVITLQQQVAELKAMEQRRETRRKAFEQHAEESYRNNLRAMCERRELTRACNFMEATVQRMELRLRQNTFPEKREFFQTRLRIARQVRNEYFAKLSKLMEVEAERAAYRDRLRSRMESVDAAEACRALERIVAFHQGFRRDNSTAYEFYRRRQEVATELLQEFTAKRAADADLPPGSFVVKDSALDNLAKERLFTESLKTKASRPSESQRRERALSPVEVETLLHCFYCREPLNPAPAYQEALYYLSNRGAVFSFRGPGDYRTTDLGDAWVKAICNAKP